MGNHNHYNCCSCHHKENYNHANLLTQYGNLKQEILPLLPVLIIYILGLIFYNKENQKSLSNVFKYCKI